MPPRDKVTYGSLRKSGLVPPLDPEQAVGNSSALQQLYGNYGNTSALLGFQRRQIRGAFGDARLAAKDQYKADHAAAVGGALDRGILGSSSDFLGREAAKDSRRATVAGARNVMTDGLMQNVAAQMQAQNDLRSGVLGVKAQKASLQSNKAYENFINDMLFGGGGGNRNRGGQVDQKSDRIHRLFRELRQVADSDPEKAAQVQDRIKELWRARNQVLKRKGKDPRRGLFDKLNGILLDEPTDDNVGGEQGP